MHKSSQIALAVAALIAVALIAYFIARQPQPSAQEQILAQLNDARRAAEAHDVRGIMAVMSADYKGHSDLDSNIDTLHLLLNRTVGKADSLTVTLAPPTVTVQGDTAVTAGQLTVREKPSELVRYDENVTLRWKREEGHRLLVLPATVWRIVSADAPIPAE